ncbi:MAG TPA: hypothetical protein VL381_08780 [Rhodocyclaceae bacterium]|nr:hypothetical protein [Rhodocyclaceae bacterium]
MKRLLIASALLAGLISSVSIPAQAQINVSVNIGDPGFFGRIDMNDAPPPQLVYRQPIAVQYVSPARPPIYLRVPPGYEANWREHCREYNACGERVYFVRDDWYRRDYAPRYAERHHGRQEERREERRDDRRDDRHDNRRDDHHDHGRGDDNRRDH